jgi:uncharacterized membrane protein YgcG
MNHTKKAISCLMALVLLIPSANAFGQEAPMEAATGAVQALPQQGTDAADDTAIRVTEAADEAPDGEGLDLAIVAYDQSGTTGAALRPAATEEFQIQITRSIASSDRFVLCTDGILNPGGGSPLYGKHYEWWIDWGDGTPAKLYTDTNNPDGPASSNNPYAYGIEHTYQGNPGDVFTLTIVPAGPMDAWLASLGGLSQVGSNGFQIAILSTFTPLMTRSASQIANPDATQPSYEWFRTFSNLPELRSTGPGFDPAWSTATKAGDYFACEMFSMSKYLMMDPAFNLPQGFTTVGDHFASQMFGWFADASVGFTMNGVFNLPQGITTVGDGFARALFADCRGDAFTMNSVFNLPQGISSAGDDFARDLFLRCRGASFTMNNDFNLPQGMTHVGEAFAHSMFEECKGDLFAMNDVFDLPQGIASVGNEFAGRMFSTCSGAAFAMNDVFNLPPGISGLVGDGFASYMLAGCTGAGFTMNSVFNLPQGITAVGDAFAYGMFSQCSGPAFTMNSVFNLPQGITTVGDAFASSLFQGCSGARFALNDVFNLPQGIYSAGQFFAFMLFEGCSGAAFTMNKVFNMPQGVVTVGRHFAGRMFFQCSGPSFQVNDVFAFPRLAQAELDKDQVFGETFWGINTAAIQKRSAISIINNPNGSPMSAPYYTLYPVYNRNTFDAAFVDLPLIHPNWGGLGQTADCVVTFDANGFAGISFPGGSIVLCQQGGMVPMPALQMAAGCRLLGWYIDAACTQAWDLATDVIPAGTTAMTLYAKGVMPLVFVDLGFNVPASTVGTAIVPIATAPGVSGGLLPYMFSAAGLPAGLSVDAASGEIAGTPIAEAPAGTAVITVSDALGQTAAISIAYGEVSKVSGNTGGNGGGNGGNGSGNGGSGSGTNSGTGGAGGNGGVTPGKGNTSGRGMVKTSDNLGIVAGGATALGLMGLLALIVFAIAALRRRRASIEAAIEAAVMNVVLATGDRAADAHGTLTAFAKDCMEHLTGKTALEPQAAQKQCLDASCTRGGIGQDKL